MILFYNVFITNARYSVGGLNRVDRLDLFKYCLASFSCIDRVTEVIIYCELDAPYKPRWQELKDYIETVFAGKRVLLYDFSPVTQPEWQIELRKHPVLTEGPAPIIYLGNDDHIFIDCDLDVLYEGVDLMSREPQSQINTLHFSSWVEAISTVYSLGEFTQVGRYWVADMLYPDAVQVVNSTFFKHVFFDLQMGDAKMRRTDPFLHNWWPYLGDYFFPSSVPHPEVKTFLPLRELVRHFDAYVHVECPLHYCPGLEIPPGFFEYNIKIAYCSETKGFYQLSPLGPDKRMLEDIPLFWRSRISELDDLSVRYSRAGLLAARNLAHKNVMTAPHMRAWQNPKVRFPAKPTDKFRDFGNGTVLPLEEKYIEVGYRTT